MTIVAEIIIRRIPRYVIESIARGAFCVFSSTNCECEVACKETIFIYRFIQTVWNMAAFSFFSRGIRSLWNGESGEETVLSR